MKKAGTNMKNEEPWKTSEIWNFKIMRTERTAGSLKT